MNYDGLPIYSGVMAAVAYDKLQTETDPAKAAATRKNLLEYCKQDTLGMVRILAALNNLV